MKHTLLAGALAIFLGSSAVTAGPFEDDSPLRLRLPAHVFMAPAEFRGLVRVTPNADNRLLRVVLDSDNFYRSSDIQLEGDSSPRSHFLMWRSLPAGSYRVVVTVFDARGPRTQITQQFLVVGEQLPQPGR